MCRLPFTTIDVDLLIQGLLVASGADETLLGISYRYAVSTEGWIHLMPVLALLQDCIATLLCIIQERQGTTMLSFVV
jgi:hypothetical protein